MQHLSSQFTRRAAQLPSYEPWDGLWSWASRLNVCVSMEQTTGNAYIHGQPPESSGMCRLTRMDRTSATKVYERPKRRAITKGTGDRGSHGCWGTCSHTLS